MHGSPCVLDEEPQKTAVHCLNDTSAESLQLVIADFIAFKEFHIN
jgi:hypothetical protein